MRTRRSGVLNWRSASVALFSIAIVCATAAQAGQVSSIFFHIEASSSLGTESWSLASNDASVNYDPVLSRWTWAGGGIALGDVATLGQANLTVEGDPQIAMGFAVVAGAAETTITITSTVLSFDPLTNPDAAAMASLTLTQSGGDPDAYLNGLAGDAGSSYAALYNDPAVVYGEYVPALSTTTTTSGSGNSGGFHEIPGAVSSMQAVYSFVLSPGDQASGTSNYLIVPEPAAVALLIAGAVFAIRRR